MSELRSIWMGHGLELSRMLGIRIHLMVVNLVFDHVLICISCDYNGIVFLQWAMSTKTWDNNWWFNNMAKVPYICFKDYKWIIVWDFYWLLLKGIRKMVYVMNLVVGRLLIYENKSIEGRKQTFSDKDMDQTKF